MNFSFYVAKRYLFSKKKHNAINIISGISVCGTALATLALVCTLSVFNGFQDMVAGLFTAFDPDLKITTRQGKVFNPADNEKLLQLPTLPEVAVCTHTLEENVMVQYQDRQLTAIIKGVEDNFTELTSITDILVGTGTFMLQDPVVEYGVPGIGITSKLGTGLQPVDPVTIYAPKRKAKVNMTNPAASFNKEYLYLPGVAFAVNQQKYDEQYILTSLRFARRLLDYTTEVSSIELKLTPAADARAVKARIEKMLGEEYKVSNRHEQQADVFRIMEVEKLISAVFLTFILVIACFNIVGSLSMLILDKKEDVLTLRKLGADRRLITRIFLFEGWMISFFGALAGMALGLLLCYVQHRFGIIKLGSDGGFLVSAYPVSVHGRDLVLIFMTVLAVGFLSVWYPVLHANKNP